MGPKPGADLTVPSQVMPAPLAVRQKRLALFTLCVPENTGVSLILFKKYS